MDPSVKQNHDSVSYQVPFYKQYLICGILSVSIKKYLLSLATMLSASSSFLSITPLISIARQCLFALNKRNFAELYCRYGIFP